MTLKPAALERAIKTLAKKQTAKLIDKRGFENQHVCLTGSDANNNLCKLTWCTIMCTLYVRCAAVHLIFAIVIEIFAKVFDITNMSRRESRRKRQKNIMM